MQKIKPFLWFDNQAEEAVNFYISLFKDSKVTKVNSIGDNDSPRGEPVTTVEFILSGVEYVALNGGPMFKFTEAFSLSVDCEDQAEVDYLWDKLTSDGGEESMCGWLKDKYGMSWQITPRRLMELISDPDKEKANRAFQAMMTMRKIDIQKLEAAVAAE